MKKKEVSELMKKFLLFGIVPFAALIVLSLIVSISISFLFGPIFMILAIIPVIVSMMLFFSKAKKMEANLCLKCVSPKKTTVTEDVRLADERIKGILCEVHRVTHVCEECGAEYICTEYKPLKKTSN